MIADFRSRIWDSAARLSGSLSLFKSGIRNPQSAIAATALFALGFLSILVQVVLLRELTVVCYGVDLIYTLAIGFWLLWTAAGAMIAPRAMNASPAALAVLFGVFALLLPLDLVFIRATRLIFAPVPGAYLPFGSQVLSVAVSLLPVGLIVGLQFQWAAKIYVAAGRSLAQGYGIESAGGLAGGLCATWMARFGVASLTTLCLGALAAISVARLLARTECSRTARFFFLPGVALIVVVAWWSPGLDRAMTAWNHPYLTYTHDSPYGRITLTRYEGQVSVFENDALTFESESLQAEEFVNLTALQHPAPAHVLILGGGIEGTVREILRHTPRQVDYVELNPVLLPLIRASLTEKSPAATAVRMFLSDPRAFLISSGSYDLILVGMPEPDSGQANRFYTAEFFRQCAARLNPGGVVGFRLRSSENVWSTLLQRRNGSIYRALKLAFPDVQVLPGSTNIFLASTGGTVRDPAVLTARFEQRQIQARLISPAFIRYVYTNDRFRQIAGLLEQQNAPPNTDTRPVSYQYTVMLWLSKFTPGIGLVEPSAPAERALRSPWTALVLAIPLVMVLARKLPALRRVLLSASAGFVGMVFETALMLYYQVKSGVLYQDIGVLLMAFMAGLAIGGYAAGRLAARKPGLSWRWGAGFLGGFALVAMGLIVGDRFGIAPGLPGTSALLLVTGFLVSSTFAYAATRGVADQRSVVAPLYSADLVGGCVGSVAATLLLIPMAGIATTAALMIPVCLISALLL